MCYSKYSVKIMEVIIMANEKKKFCINDAIARANELRLNVLSDEQKYTWVYELECRVCEMMGKDIPKKNFPENIELSLPEAHSDVYVKHLVAKIDYYNGEMGLYANDMEVFNQAMDDACSWWIRHNKPARARRWVV